MSPGAMASLKVHPALLIASIGNPSPYLNTLHSAGHHLLAHLAALLSAPLLTNSMPKLARGNCSHTHHPSDPDVPWTLWESPVQMNISGKAVKKAWTAWSEGEGEGAGTVESVTMRRHMKKRLVVLHDELEAPLGKVKLRGGLGTDVYSGHVGKNGKKGSSNGDDAGSVVASAKGHNGVQSVLDAFRKREKAKQQQQQQHLQQPQHRLDEISSSSIIRVGVGIGRPVSRDASEISKYVLRPMTEREKSLMEWASDEVLKRLQALKVHVGSEEIE